ncbi:hypothetical protein [Streptomyces sp. Da 82-17]|uniref:hypothetical protein n=1 Tax=Streptomyces sp. Da 82-17 TaxID=3377116 RepID=UPI0038D39D67
MRIELATEPGDPGRPNEDYASVALPASGKGGTLVLLDGVTPPAEDYGCLHSVPWFTARLGGALGELSGSRRDLGLREVLAAAIARTADAHRQTCDLSHVRTPQATVVLVRWDEERVEHLVLSDSALLVEAADGTVRAVLDERLGALPAAVGRLRAAVRALPDGSPERAAAAREYVAAVEALRNAEGGFFTAAADPDVARRAVCGAEPRSAVRSVAALTDGATRWVERFGAGGWTECLALLRKAGPQELIDRVRALESAEAAGPTAPRGKLHDDAAVVFAEL